MPVLAGPAIDPTLAGAAELVVSAGPLDAPIPPAPPATAALELAAGSRVPLVQVLLGRAISREVIGELTTAHVANYCREVELLAGCTASITASSFDPLWEACAESVTMGVDGRKKYTFDPGGFVVWIYVESVCVWTGRFSEPVDFGDGTVGLPAQGPQSVFDERILGRPEQPDLLEGRGSFERYESIDEMVADGWVFPAGMLRELVEGEGPEGQQCLRIKGEGWVRSPRVTVMGADGYGRAITGSTFGRWNQKARTGKAIVRTFVQRTDSLVPTNEQLSKDEAGGRPDIGEQWTDGPIDSGARMSPYVFPHRGWTEIRGFGGLWSYYDVTTLRESIQTGFPPGTNRDLAEYVVRIHRDLVSRSLGGSPTGLTVRIVSYTGVESSQRWSHARRTPVRDVLSMVLDADGGPECRITTGWVLEVHNRLGTASDITLSVHEILKPGWSIDPGARIEDFAVDTGRGSGVSAIVAVVEQPWVDDQWRRFAQVTGPTDRTLNEIRSWARAHARTAARIQTTTEVEVPWPVGDQLNEGDTLYVIQHDGDVAAPEVRMRALRIRCNLDRWTATLTLGADE